MLVSGAQHNDPWKPTPVFLPEKSHGQRSLAGYSPRGHKESDTAEWLSTAQWLRGVCVCACTCVCAFPSSSAGKEVSCDEGSTGDEVWSLGREDPLEKGRATHSSTVAWRLSMNRGAWWAAVHGFTESWTRLSLSTYRSIFLGCVAGPCCLSAVCVACIC